MKQICPVCLRKISTTINGAMLRHGFKRNNWELVQNVYRKVDGSPCKGTGRYGLTLKQLNKEK